MNLLKIKLISKKLGLYLTLCFFIAFNQSNAQQTISDSENVVLSSPVLPPLFSETSGFFYNNLQLTLSHPDPDAVIVYTLDGSQPDILNSNGTEYSYKNVYPEMPGNPFGAFLTNSYTSLIYDTSILLEARSNEPNKLATISTTYRSNPSFQSSPVLKAAVVRAIAVVDGEASKTITHTYFISEENELDFSLPIVSINLNEDAFFDYDEGIHVAGIDFDEWRTNNPNNQSPQWGDANYKRRGIETEQAASFQYFVNEQEVLSQNIGVRIHGGQSRNRPNKTLRLYARSSYDTQNSFNYPFFGPQDAASFKRLLLRNSGNDDNSIFFRDALVQTSVSHLRFDTQSYQPAVVFVNGEYWGILNIRNRYDKHYYERVYGIEEEDLEYLNNNARINEGDNTHFLMMRDYISNNDMSNTAHYEHVKTLMDVENFTDYFISNIYVTNRDWPGNNIDYFRKNTPQYEPDAPYGQDGRWRWSMFDTDFAFGLNNNANPSHNTLAFATAAGGSSWPNPDWSTLILRNLLDNENFKINFINRFADLMNTAFLASRYEDLINEMSSVIAPEIPRQIHRWNRLGSVNAWNNRVQAVKNFTAQRASFQRDHILDQFNIDHTINLQLDLSNHNGGFIKVNTVKINGSTPGVSEQPYPWNGVYFSDIPLSFKAIANPGAQFSHWSGASNSTNAEITITSNQDLELTAHFIPIENSENQLLYFWLLDNNLPNNTPLESIAATYSYNSTQTQAVIHYQSALAGYPFSASHPQWRNSSLERRNSPTPINYRPEGNDNIAYEEVTMRGVQVKQAFQVDNLENILLFAINTTFFEDISASFAIKDEGAADSIIVEYLNPNTQNWSTENINNFEFLISDEYQLVEIDFSEVEVANDAENFNFRIRFEGQDMTANNGNRVTFNNIAIEGTPIPLSIENIEREDKIVVFPNPFNDNIQISSAIEEDYNYKIFSIEGRLVQSGKVTQNHINTTSISKGFYILQLSSESEKNAAFKLIKQ